MSRTQRRTGYSRDRKYLLQDWQYVDGAFLKRFIDPKSKEGRKLLAIYHSDAGSFMGSAPGWYCNIFQRRIRQEARQQIHRYLRCPENLDLNVGYSVSIQPNHRHSATWAWW